MDTKNATPDTNSQVTASMYLRVSADRSGHGSSVADQHTELCQVADDEGWTLAGSPYADQEISASRYTTKKRYGYEALTDDLKNNRFKASVLMLWESSRGSRRTGEWVLLCDLLAECGVRVYVHRHRRTYDPRRGPDRETLLTEAVRAEGEVSAASDRIKRRVERSAVAGKPHGKKPFGYARSYDPVTRTPQQVPDPTEAPIIRELFDRIHRGHSIQSITDDFAQRGITRRSGKNFTRQQLRSMALLKTYIGVRVHNGQETAGAWEPIVDEPTFYAVQHKLTDQQRKTTRPGRARHWLSLIARCGKCAGYLSVRTYRKGGTTFYYCRTSGCVALLESDLDAYSEVALLEYLTQPAFADRLAANANGGAELETARADVARIQAELNDLADNVASGALSATLAARSEPKLRERLDAAKARVRELQTPSTLHGLLGEGDGVESRWRDMPLSAKREVARLLFSSDYLGVVYVHHAPNGRYSDVTERVTIER